jgi:hypothetical protein
VIVEDHRYPITDGPDGFVTTAVVHAARRTFGSLHAAIIAAGLDPELVLRHVDRSELEIRSMLHKLATENPDMTVSELHDHKIGSLLANRFGTMRVGLEHFGLDTWPTQIVEPAPPAEVVLVGLRRRRRQGQSLRSSDVLREDARLRNAAIKHFGGWGQALQAAGLGRHVRVRRTRQQVLVDLVARHARREPLDWTTMFRDDRALLSSAESHFRSLRRALMAARLPLPHGALKLRPGERFEQWSADRVRSEIRDLHRNGKPLASNKVRPRLKDAGVRYFGSWGAAIEAIGLDYDRIAQRRKPWTRAELVAELRKGARSRRTGVGPNGFVTKPVALAVRHVFGSLRAGIEAAGLEAEHVLLRTRRSDLELRSLLQQLASDEPDMTVTELKGHKLGSILAKRFGNMHVGLKQFGFDEWPRWVHAPALSREEVIAGVRSRHRRGDSMRSLAVIREERRLHSGALKHFGTWDEAQTIALGSRWRSSRSSRGVPTRRRSRAR